MSWPQHIYCQEFFSGLDVTCVQFFSSSSSGWRSSRTDHVLTLELVNTLEDYCFLLHVSQSDCHRVNGAPTPKFVCLFFFTVSVGQLIAGFQLHPCGEEEVLQGDTVCSS